MMVNTHQRAQLYAQIVHRVINALIRIRLRLKNVLLEHILSVNKVLALSVQLVLDVTLCPNSHVIPERFHF